MCDVCTYVRSCGRTLRRSSMNEKRQVTKWLRSLRQNQIDGSTVIEAYNIHDECIAHL